MPQHRETPLHRSGCRGSWLLHLNRRSTAAKAAKNCSGGRDGRTEAVVAGADRCSPEKCSGGIEMPGSALKGGGCAFDEGGREKPCPSVEDSDSGTGAGDAGGPEEEAMQAR